MPIVRKPRDVNKNPKTHSKQAHWSQKQKFNAVVTYLLVGNLPATAAATGVPLWTLRKWVKTPWWKQMEDEARISRNIEISAKLSKVTEKVLNQLEDRLDKGDIYYNTKTQQVTRAPINAKTLNTIAKDSIDRQVLMERLVREEPEQATKEDIKLHLTNLMDEFRKLVKKPGSKPLTIEGEITNVETGTETEGQVLRASEEASGASE